MTRRRSIAILGLSTALLATWSVREPAHADVHVGINVGVPPPPVLAIPAPPRLVVVPGAPVIQYAPDLGYDYYSYGGRYYTVQNDNWFVASDYGGPWAYVPRERVPRPFFGVPVRYRKGHWRDDDRGRARRHRRHDSDHDHRGRGHRKHDRHDRHD